MGFLAQLDTVGPYLIGAGISGAAIAFTHCERRLHRWRLARRLRRNPYIQAEELREYERAIGDDLPPFDTRRLALGALFLAVLGVPLGMAGARLETLGEYGEFIVGAVGASLLLWRRLNDPPEAHAEFGGLPDVAVPRDAWLGLAGGLFAVALIVLLITTL